MDRPDHRAFTALYSAHYGAVLGFVRRRLADASVDDVVADVFTTVWHRLDDVPDDPRPWIFGVARNTLLTAQRGHARRAALSVRIAARPAGPVPDHSDGVADTLDLVAAWQRLSPAHQEAIALVTHDGLTGAEAAQVLGCSRSAFSVRLVRARRTLRTFLDIEARAGSRAHDAVPHLSKEMTREAL